MNSKYQRIKNLFLKQSYLSSWDDFSKSITKARFIRWDYVILTASNEEQAAAFRAQIEYRQANGWLPPQIRFEVLSDPDGVRVGSGGATLNVLDWLARRESGKQPHFANKRILVIHSGGDSKRVPQYSACGKLFSPVPRKLPNGQPSTLFDEFMVALAGVPSRIREGMLVLSGDVLLLFNPLQIDTLFHGALAISMKESVSTGKDHGVFLSDSNGLVRRFLHKQTEEMLRAQGAVNEMDDVDLDTGAILMDCDMLRALYGLISTDGKPDDRKRMQFINEKARLSFYGDFLYPLAQDSTLEQYYRETPEGCFTEELKECRTQVWNALKPFSLSMISLSPARFIHFGTTVELLRLLTTEIADYEFLGWSNRVIVNDDEGGDFAAYNSFISEGVSIGSQCYIEDSLLKSGTVLREGSIASGVQLENCTIPAHTVVSGLRQKNGQYVLRTYGVADNPKKSLEENGSFLNTTLAQLMRANGLDISDLWTDSDHTLWTARLFPRCADWSVGMDYNRILYQMAEEAASASDIAKWRAAERTSLRDSFNQSDVTGFVPWKHDLQNHILVDSFIKRIKAGDYYIYALKEVFGKADINEAQLRILLDKAREEDFFDRIKLLYDISCCMKLKNATFSGYTYDDVETMCFRDIRETITAQNVFPVLPCFSSHKIAKDEVKVELPVRVNWGGGWTDTPPYCNEKGGVVLNAAIKLNGTYPIQVTIRRLDELKIVFESADVGAHGEFRTIEEIRNYNNPYDPFALHKAGLLAVGVIPLNGDYTLEEILRRIGGGIYLETHAVNVPKGSGLGTSSILSGACAGALCEFMNLPADEEHLFNLVLHMEQLMSTGGGWQDQVGGILPGVKFITSRPGIHQDLKVTYVRIPAEAKKELADRFALIYTGQRRLARNLLRDVVGGYLNGKPESINALEQMPRIAALMRFELEQGNIDRFAQLLNEHWQLSIQLDSGTTNTCIDQIFMAIEDMIDGRFISGAGGGGFLQVILKKGVTREMLSARLKGVFQGSGIDVWDTEFIWND